MNMVKRNFMEAITFYDRNKWLTLFCVIGLIFTTDIAFFNGLGGVCYNIGVCQCYCVSLCFSGWDVVNVIFLISKIYFAASSMFY